MVLRKPSAATGATMSPWFCTRCCGNFAVTITVGDNFSFEPAVITVRAGQPVELTLRNDGQLPHDVTLTEASPSR